MSLGRYYLVPILLQNKIYSHTCCYTKTRSIEIYSSNNDIKQPIIVEDKVALKDNVSDKFKDKNKQNIEKMLKFIKNDISQSDIDEIITLLYNINDSNCKSILCKIYRKLNIDSYLNIIKIDDLIYIFTYDEIFVIPGIHYFYFEETKKNKNIFLSNKDVEKIESCNNIKSDIFKILCEQCLNNNENKNLPLETINKIFKNLEVCSNYNFTIQLGKDSFCEDFYIVIDYKKYNSKYFKNIDSLKNDHDSFYKIIKICTDKNKIEFINRVK